MRTHNTKGIIFLFILLLTSIGVNAQSNDSIISTRKYNHQNNLMTFRTSLQSEIPGIVEGTIYVVILYKKYFPELDYTKIINNLIEVEQGNKNPSISHKAYLALMYLRHANTIEITPVLRAVDHEYIFKEISQELEKK